MRFLMVIYYWFLDTKTNWKHFLFERDGCARFKNWNLCVPSWLLLDLRVRAGGLEDLQHAGAGDVPHIGAELLSVQDDQVLQAVGSWASQLLVVYGGEQKKLQDGQSHSDGGTFWRLSPTLPDAPLQLREDVGQQDFAERLIKLSEDVADGVQRVVARRRHPLGFLGVDEGKKIIIF